MQIFLKEPLSKHGYWRVGGEMDRLVVVETEAELQSIYPEVNWVLGNGSNLLAPDSGLRGTTLRLALRDSTVVADDGENVLLKVGAGLLNTVLLSRIARLSLGGLASLAGVPGTVGGAIAMNAGTALGEIADTLHAIEGIDAQGFRSISRADLPMHYREGGLPEGFIVSSATFKLQRSTAETERQHILAHLQRRKATQPLDLPSCGSVFRNPPGDHAGRLIEAAGLRGWRCGEAQISARHANFIVNLGGATASDVMQCIHQAWVAVRQKSGVSLIPEVRVLGDWPATRWPLG